LWAFFIHFVGISDPAQCYFMTTPDSFALVKLNGGLLLNLGWLCSYFNREEAYGTKKKQNKKKTIVTCLSPVNVDTVRRECCSRAPLNLRDGFSRVMSKRGRNV